MLSGLTKEISFDLSSWSRAPQLQAESMTHLIEKCHERASVKLNDLGIWLDNLLAHSFSAQPHSTTQPNTTPRPAITVWKPSGDSTWHLDVLFLYHNMKERLPSVDELLICTPYTTLEQAQLFVHRWQRFTSKLFCVVCPEVLHPSVQALLLPQLRESAAIGCSAAPLACIIEREDSPFATLGQLRCPQYYIDQLKSHVTRYISKKVHVIYTQTAGTGKSTLALANSKKAARIPLFAGVTSDVIVGIARAQVLAESVHFDMQVRPSPTSATASVASWKTATQRLFGTTRPQQIDDPVTTAFEFIFLGGISDHMGRFAPLYAKNVLLEVGFASASHTGGNIDGAHLHPLLRLFPQLQVPGIESAQAAIPQEWKRQATFPSFLAALGSASSVAQAFAVVKLVKAASATSTSESGLSSILQVAPEFLRGVNKSWSEATRVPQLLLGTLVSGGVAILDGGHNYTGSSLRDIPTESNLTLGQLAGFATGNENLASGSAPNFALTTSIVKKMALLHSCILAQVPLVLVYVFRWHLSCGFVRLL
jgi:hypothetical protein